MKRWLKTIICFSMLLLLTVACNRTKQPEIQNQEQAKTILDFYESLHVSWNESRIEVEKKYGEARLNDFDQEYYDISQNTFFNSVTPLDQFLTVLYNEEDRVSGLLVQYHLSSEEEQQAWLAQIQLACKKEPDAYFDGGAENQFYGYTLSSLDLSISCIRIDEYNYEASIQLTPR